MYRKGAYDRGHMTVTTGPRQTRRREELASRRRSRWPAMQVPDERRAKRLVGLAWVLLVLNALTFYPGVSVLHIPSLVGKAITQGALPLALLCLVAVNRRLIIRPNVYLSLLSLLLFPAIITSFEPQHLGTVYRTFRLAEFIAALWLLTPWWGRRDLLLLRCHLITINVLLGTVILGLLVSPGRAHAGGRLSGVIWPVPSTQVAHYAAVASGVLLLMWFCGRLRSWRVLAVVVIQVALLVFTHTRTALVAEAVGLIIAGMSLVKVNSRVRKVYATVGIIAVVAALTMSGFILSWLARGEGTKELTDLTGRTIVWGEILSYPRNTYQMILGFGLSNSSFNGLPIDSNWLSSYTELGIFGVSICVLVLIFVLINAYFQPRSMERAIALFLVVYCIMASVTETGITDVSPYMLEVTLAASMMFPVRTPHRLTGWQPARTSARQIVPRPGVGTAIINSDSSDSSDAPAVAPDRQVNRHDPRSNPPDGNLARCKSSWVPMSPDKEVGLTGK